MRPGTKVKFWSPKFTNRPDIDPPGLLKLVSAVSIFSIVAFLVFAVGKAFVFGGLDANAPEVAYVVMLHFILPFLAFYTVTNNSPLSRWVIALYSITLSGATIAGKGLLGDLSQHIDYRTEIAVGAMVIVMLWLFASPKMRFYYAAVSGKPPPPDLEARADELRPKDLLGAKGRAALDWLLGHAETMVLLGFIILAFYAFASSY